MKRTWLLILLSFLALSAVAQSDLWVFFTNKGPDASARLAHPETLLSPQALAIRAEKGIALSEGDLPVYEGYLADLTAHGYTVTATSRWLNAAAIAAPTQGAASLHQLSYVSETRPVRHLTRYAYPITEPLDEIAVRAHVSDDPLDYGEAAHQNNQVNVVPLHERGFTGRGVRIAVLDAGFPGVDTIPAFDSLHLQDRIITTYDFVDDTSFVYHANSHGTNVLSTIAANQPGMMIGTAPHASFILCRTEDAGSETQVEEKYFMQAVEFADSVGVDVIHASLGYSEFDEGIGNYTYEDLNGDVAITTRAVDMAAQRGIIVTSSAGNEGDSDWRYISVPADADSILTVGAVDRNGKLAYFSSVGPTADGRIKPDVVAMGMATTVIATNGRLSRSNGTSFSGPIMAGVMACLRQAHPDRSNMDLIQAIRLSGDQSQFPDNEYGYGIPNAAMADSLLANFEDLSKVEIEMESKPERVNPTASAFTPKEKEKKLVIFTDDPKSVVKQKGSKIIVSTETANTDIRDLDIYRGDQLVLIDPKDIKTGPYEVKVKTKWLLPGEYYLQITTGEFEEFIPFAIK